MPNDQHFTETLPDGTTFDMLFVQGGEFMMGADKKSDPEAQDDEQPVHKVRVSDFYLGKYPVTQGLWQAVMGSNPSYFIGERRPVEQVSWHEAQAFIKKLNELTGKSYGLPSEAMWEYAARGGAQSEGYKYAGSDKLREVGWYRENSHQETKEVGLKYPNELGLYDMSGNVFEWCEDWYSSSYYKECHTKGVVENPPGAATGANRVRRGGSWSLSAQDCRATYRLGSTPEYRYGYSGFRVAFFP